MSQNPPMSPIGALMKPKSAPQLARMPQRMPKPIPAASIARNPAHNRRLAFGATASWLTLPLLIVFPQLPCVWPITQALREVLDQEDSAFAGTDYIEIPVAVDIYHRNLHAGTHPAAIVDDVADPLPLLRSREFIAVRAKRLLFVGVPDVLGHESFAGDQYFTPASIQMAQRGGVRGRPGTVGLLH